MMKVKIFPIGHVILVTLSLFLIVPTSVCNNDDITRHVITNETQAVKETSNLLNANLTNNKDIPENGNKAPSNIDKIPETITTNATNTNNSTKINDNVNNLEPSNTKPHSHSPELDSGAVTRAFFVFVGLSVIVVAYLIFRSFRLRNSPAQMVRKYGVLAHKQDIEMRPLPLDDDDDDDTTVFDISNLKSHSNQTA